MEIIHCGDLGGTCVGTLGSALGPTIAAGCGGVAQRALEELDLLEAVARHKDAFFHTGWSRYEEARAGSFRLVPSGRLLESLRADYVRMQPMLFGPAPSFDELVEALRRLEVRINAAG